MEDAWMVKVMGKVDMETYKKYRAYIDSRVADAVKAERERILKLFENYDVSMPVEDCANGMLDVVQRLEKEGK